MVVELVFLVASTSLAVVLTGHGPVSAGVLALALAAPTVVAAGLAILITRLRGSGPAPTCGCAGRGADCGSG